MAEISSFRGYRFNANKAGDLNKVVTQPYDNIDDALRNDYMQRSENNVVRIIKDAPRPMDTPNDNQYTRAADCWTRWIEDEVLLRESGPAIYAYLQEYTVEGKTFVRKGVIVLVSLDDPRTAVRAHEKTLSGPKADRLKLMRATEANDGQIFMLYPDPENKVNGMIDEELGLSGLFAPAEPTMEVTDDFGAIHRLYRITSPSLVHDIADLMKNWELFIADGHHRYETAVNYMNECKSRNWKPMGLETFTHRMMTLVNMYDPGLTILPTHRVLHSLDGFNPANFLAKAAGNFEIAEFTDRSALYEALDAAGQTGRSAYGFGAVGMDGYRLLTLKDPAIMDQMVSDHSEAWKRLDVTVLHIALLEKLLGIDAEKLAAETNVHYVRGRDESLDRLGDGKHQAAFLINPTRIDQVREVASAGERMPQKSTDFFPKLLTGMVMMKMKIDKSAGLIVWQADG